MTEVHNSISARFRDDPTVRAGWLEKTTRQCEFQSHLSILVFPYGFNYNFIQLYLNFPNLIRRLTYKTKAEFTPKNKQNLPKLAGSIFSAKLSLIGSQSITCVFKSISICLEVLKSDTIKIIINEDRDNYKIVKSGSGKENF